MRTEKLKELLAQLIEEEANKEEEEKASENEVAAKSSADQKTEKSKEESTPSQDSGDDQGHLVNSSTCYNSYPSDSIRDDINSRDGESPDSKWVRIMDIMCKKNSLDSTSQSGKRWRALV